MLRASRPGPSRAVALLVAALLCGVLAGCSSIPTSGAVVPGGPVQVDEPPPAVTRIPPAPVPGDSTTQLVQRFLDAMAVYEPGYPTAGLYLASDSRGRWQPSSRITVYDGGAGATPVRVGADRVRVSLVRLATIDGDGTYRRDSRPRRETVELRLVREDGEWRIADPPRGVLMSEFDVGLEFAPYEVFFPSADGRVLVPDEVFLPIRGALATLLVTALLRGAPSDIAPAVRTAFPRGAALTSPGVPVEGGTAAVALTAQGAEVPDPQRTLMAAQLGSTLGQLEAVSGVAFTLDGVAVTAGGPPDGVTPVTSWTAFDAAAAASSSALYAVSAGRLVTVAEDGSLAAVPGPLGAAGAGLRSVAVAPGAGRAAGVSVDGRRLATAVLAADAEAIVEPGVDLSAPSWDRLGRLWVAERGGTRPGLRVVPPDGPALRVPVGGGAGDLGDVRRVRVSADGARVALVVGPGGAGGAGGPGGARGGGTRLLVGLVVGPAEAPRVEALRELDRVPRVLDVAWATPTELAVLGAGEQPTDRVPSVTLLGLSEASAATRGGVPDATSIAAAPDQAPVLGSSTGQLARLLATEEWSRAGTASAPAYVG